MTQKLYIKTMGCQMNVYDAKRMHDVLEFSHGMQSTTDAAEADMLLLNTCAIREKAAEKVFSELGRWRRLKQKNPDLVIGVGGCVASQQGALILERAPYVDIVFGPQTLHRLPQLYDDVQNKKTPAIDISFPAIEKFDNLPPVRSDGVTAFVSIMEGCSKYCSFCVVPYTRGEEMSRTFDTVISEVFELAAQGVREVNLLGQNVNAYRGSMHDGRVADLATLIEYIAEIDGIDRIRYTTSHPVEFSDALIDVYARVPQLVNHLHLPVQSGSDRMLALMKRGYTVSMYKEKVNKLLALRPNLSLSSDFIIGFPGETEDDFQATMDLVEELMFDQSFSFIYSKRPGTPAATLPDATLPEEKKIRLSKLQMRLREFAEQKAQAMVGTTESVLVEGSAKKNIAELSGRAENNRIINFPGSQTLLGQFVAVKITAAGTNSLRGELQ